MYENYAKIRDSKGLKDADVSRGTGIASGVFSDWKKGRYELRYEKLKRIADFLEVPVDVIAEGNRSYELQKDLWTRMEYMIDEMTAHAAQNVFDDPNLRLLFDAAEGSRPEDIKMAADLLTRLKEARRDV